MYQIWVSLALFFSCWSHTQEDKMQHLIHPPLCGRGVIKYNTNQEFVIETKLKFTSAKVLKKY